MAVRKTRLSREDWTDAALAAIAAGGLAAVAVEPLAARLGATKGSFYWHFANREALLDAALARWEETTTTAVISEVTNATGGALEQLRLLVNRVVRVAERDAVGPALLANAAEPRVKPVVERVTRARIGITERLFRAAGFSAAEARARALLAYSAYLGHEQLAHSTPGVLPRTKAARAAYLDHVVRTLTAR